MVTVSAASVCGVQTTRYVGYLQQQAASGGDCAAARAGFRAHVTWDICSTRPHLVVTVSAAKAEFRPHYVGHL